MSSDTHAELPPPGPRFVEELNKTGFSIFKPIADLGYYAWQPDLKGRSPFNKVSVHDMKRQLHENGQPADLVDTGIIALPLTFNRPTPQLYSNKYVQSNFEIVGVYVATKIRGLNLNDIDFAFGGSTLSMLASKNKDKKTYLVTKIPGTTVGLVAKYDPYNLNLTEVGYQFERVVTGKPIDEIPEPTFTDHLQLMQVGKYKILFIADAGALQDGEPLEVTCSNPQAKGWAIKKCFRCVSSGSPGMCQGIKDRGGMVTSINIKSLSTFYEAKAETLKKAEGEIVSARDDLKQQLDSSNH